MANELFITRSDELPKPLDKAVLHELFIRYKNGDKETKNLIVYHNIRLVLYRVFGKFKNVRCDKGELISIGNIALVKAVDGYDINKNIEFSTYAVKCIDYEIMKYLKKTNKLIHADSLDRELEYKYTKKIKVADLVVDGTDILEDYLEKERMEIIKEIIYSLPEREKEIIVMIFGLDGYSRCTQTEIAKKFDITQANVSLIVTKIIRKIKYELTKRRVVEQNELLRLIKK